tara:strand:- start:19 stop:576 length:558 start_codon:yes stop_codon:yes gene_type:complete
MKLWVVTAINVSAAVVALVCCAYLVGIQDAHNNTDTSTGHTSAAKRVYPNPTTGHGLHPTFDCKAMGRTLQSSEGGLETIAGLAKNAHTLKDETVSVRGVVVQAFPNIMGVNWFCICERPQGEVLVVSGKSWAEPGSVVVAKGALSVNRNVGGAYQFPLYIEDGALEGPGVQPAKTPDPNSTFYL